MNAPVGWRGVTPLVANSSSFRKGSVIVIVDDSTVPWWHASVSRSGRAPSASDIDLAKRAFLGGREIIQEGKIGPSGVHHFWAKP